jgi:Tfp pilus assembly protein PilX
MRTSSERGIAMITVLLVMMLMSALLVGFTTVVMSDQRYRFIDRDRSQSFYGAAAGIEKLTADLGNLFLTNVAPSGTQVTALTNTSAQPVLPGVSFAADSVPDASRSPATARRSPASRPTRFGRWARTATRFSSARIRSRDGRRPSIRRNRSRPVRTKG